MIFLAGRDSGFGCFDLAAMWNSFIAGFIFDHDSTASLIRELNRNSQLREICGFQPHYHTGRDGVVKIMYAPTASAYSNFINNLRECREEIREMFDSLVNYMYENLDNFGDILMVDGKTIQSFAARPSKKKAR